MSLSASDLKVRISADASGMAGTLKQLGRDVGGLAQQLKAMASGVRGQVEWLRTAAAPVASVFKAILSETGKAQAQLAQLRAALESTGEAAGYNQQQLVDMAQQMAAATTLSSGDIVEAQTRLLSYSGIVGEQFPRALKLAIDQSVRLGQSVTSAAEAVGRALESPAEGVASLTRQGFRFSQAQKDLLRELERTGKLGEAQAIVMEVMEESYQGAAEAARNTLPGALAALRTAFSDLLDGSGGGGIGTVTQAVNHLVDILRSPQTRAAFAELADRVLRVAGAFVDWFAQRGIGFVTALAQAVAALAGHLDVLAVALGTWLLAAAMRSFPAIVAYLGALMVQLRAAVVQATALRAALALMGGPVGLAVAALSAALYVLATRTDDASQAAEKHALALEEVNRLTRISASAARDAAKEKLEQAQASIKAAQAVLQEAQAHFDAAQLVNRQAGMFQGEAGLYGAGYAEGEAARRVVQSRQRLHQLIQQAVQWQLKLEELEDKAAQETPTPRNPLDPAGTLGKQLAASNALLRDAVSRALAELERMNSAGEVPVAAYYATRRALQEQAIDLDIEQAQAELALTTGLEQRRRLEERIDILQRNRAEVAARSAREEAAARADLAQQLAALERATQAPPGIQAAGAAERERARREHARLLRHLEDIAGESGQRQGERLVDGMVAKVQQEVLTSGLARIQQSLQSLERAVSAQMGAGMLGQGEGERQLQDARAVALADLQALRTQAQAAMAAWAIGSPEHTAAVQGLQALDAEIAQITIRQQQWQQSIQTTAIDSLGSALGDLITGAKDFKNAFKDMVASFVQGVARMVAQELALRAIRGLFGAWFGGPAGAVAAGVHHLGGIVGNAVRTRAISPLLLGHAPRYHSGGIAGLRPNEIPAILQRGEEVLTRNDPRHRFNAGNSGSYDRVVVHNYSAGSIDARPKTTRMPDGREFRELIINVAADDMANGGVLAQAGKQRFGWSEA